MIVALTLVAVGFLTGLDAWLTRRRVKKYGYQVELNPGLTRLAALVGLDTAILLALGIPWMLAIAGFAAWGSAVAAAFLLGFRANMTVLQLYSLKAERQLDELLKSRPQ